MGYGTLGMPELLGKLGGTMPMQSDKHQDPSPQQSLTGMCPSCHKYNTVATQPSNGSSFGIWEVKCAYCAKPWQALLPGPVVAGPFPTEQVPAEQVSS